MTTPFHFSTTYQLDKSHFSETFDESTNTGSRLADYFKSIIFVFFGVIILLVGGISPYLGWFAIALAAIDALSVKYKKPWWLARQMLSKAANSELTLTIDEKGVSSKSFYVDSALKWDDMNKIEQTKQGWLLYHARGKFYISNRCLSHQAADFLRGKMATISN